MYAQITPPGTTSLKDYEMGAQEKKLPLPTRIPAEDINQNQQDIVAAINVQTVHNETLPHEAAAKIIAAVQEVMKDYHPDDVLDAMWLAFLGIYGPGHASRNLRLYLNLA